MSLGNRAIETFVMPDGAEVQGYKLEGTEQRYLTELLYNFHGANPDLKALAYYHKPAIEMYLGYVMKQMGQPFVGTRRISPGVTGAVLHPQHLASVASAATNINIGGWKCELSDGAGKGWRYRTQAGAATSIFENATIPEYVFPCIMGYSTDVDHSTTAFSVAATQQVCNGIKLTINGHASQNIALYSTTSRNPDVTPLTYTPFFILPHRSTWTEELYVNATTAANTTAFNLRILGFAFGPGTTISTL